MTHPVLPAVHADAVTVDARGRPLYDPVSMPTVRLKPGHVQPVWAGHPWVYAQAIDAVDRGTTAGDEVSVIDPRGNLLGRGFYSPGSAIPVRLLVRDAETPIDRAFFRARIEQAVALRSAVTGFVQRVRAA